MENYAKAVLYAYPLLKNIGEEYEIHIRNKAILSYKHSVSALLEAERIAEQIVEQRKLAWLKERVERVLDKLSDVERALLGIRYFGKERKIKKTFPLSPLTQNERAGVGEWSERKYFRRQQRLSQKVGAMLTGVGVTKELFEREYAQIDALQKIYRFVCEGRDKRLTISERRWLRG